MQKRKNNNGVFYVVISLVAVLAIVSGAVAYSVSQNVNVEGDYNYYEAEGQPTPPIVEEELGGMPGPNIMNGINVHGPITYGSGSYIATSSSGSASTLSKKDLEKYLISFTSNVNAYTFTMPATSTMLSLLTETGGTREWLIHNATTTAATTLTVAAGGGMDLVSVTSDDDVIDGGEFTELKCTHIPYLDANNEDVMCIVNELANSD